MSHKYCTKCKTDKDTSQFSPNVSKNDGLQTHCKECRQAYNRRWYQDNTELQNARNKISRDRIRPELRRGIQSYLREHPCVDCGNSDIEVLEFDHRDASTKEFAVADYLKKGANWQRILAEIAKCDVRCANCHRKKSRRQLGWWIEDVC